MAFKSCYMVYCSHGLDREFQSPLTQTEIALSLSPQALSLSLILTRKPLA